MSFNFPLILVLSTAITGLIWLVDIYLLRPKRIYAADAVRKHTQKETEDAIDHRELMDFILISKPFAVGVDDYGAVQQGEEDGFTAIAISWICD